MSIDSQVLEYLQVKRKATTEQVMLAVPAGKNVAYLALRRLALAGRVKKTTKRDFTTGCLLAYWRIKKAHASPDAVPQSWLSALEWKPGK